MILLSIDSINNNPTIIPKDITIEFIYTEKIYEEIEFTQAIGFENWLSNVGGFVGIFLGYSMMQFPEALSFIFEFFSKQKYKNLVRKYLNLNKLDKELLKIPHEFIVKQQLYQIILVAVGLTSVFFAKLRDGKATDNETKTDVILLLEYFK